MWFLTGSALHRILVWQWCNHWFAQKRPTATRHRIANNMSLMLAFYKDWKSNERKVNDFDLVSKILEEQVKTSDGCRKLLQKWHAYVDEKEEEEEELKFTEII